jgi:hypothetical protein
VEQDYVFGIDGQGTVMAHGLLPGWWRGGHGVWLLVDLLGLFNTGRLAYAVYCLAVRPEAKPGLFTRLFHPETEEMARQIKQITLAAGVAALVFVLTAPWFTMRVTGLRNAIWLLPEALMVAGVLGTFGAYFGYKPR